MAHTRVKDNAVVVDEGHDRQRPARRLEEPQHCVEEPGEVFVTHRSATVNYVSGQSNDLLLAEQRRCASGRLESWQMANDGCAETLASGEQFLRVKGRLLPALVGGVLRNAGKVKVVTVQFN